MEAVRKFLARKNIVFSAKRYFIDAMGAMAQGLFCSLLIGTILNTLGSQFHIDFLTAQIAEKVLAHEVVGVGDARLAHVRELGATLGDDVVFIFGGSRGRLGLRNCLFAQDRKYFKKNIGEYGGS